MHRSGASALTRVLNLFGAALPRHVTAEQPGNPGEYGEPAQLARLHDAMLAEGGSRWDDSRPFDLAALGPERLAYYRAEIARLIIEEYGDADLIVINDPRICRFVTLYQDVLQNLDIAPSYVIALCAPRDAAASLAAHDGFSTNHGSILWLRYLMEAERATQRWPRAIVSYEGLLQDWRIVQRRISDALHLTWPHAPDDVAAEIDSYLATDLQRGRIDEAKPDFEPKIEPWIENGYSAFKALERESGRSNHTLDQIDSKSHSAADFSDGEFDIKFAAYCANVEQHRDEIFRLRNVNSLLREELAQTNTNLARANQLTHIQNHQIAQFQAEAATYGARIGRLLTQMRARLAPVESQRGRIAASALRSAHYVYRIGVLPTAQTYLKQTRAKLLGRNDEITRQATPAEYGAWLAASEPNAKALKRQQSADRRGLLISVILPVYKIAPAILAATVHSLQRQTYRHWEACIAYADPDGDNWDLLENLARQDKRLRLIRLPENKGISGNSNAALEIAEGDYIALLDHDDELAPFALFQMAQAIAKDPDADFLYSDKDCIDEQGTTRLNPLFKPEWSPEMLYSVNYLTHLNIIRKKLVTAVGGWRTETDGAQDWDFFRRPAERARKIVRAPGVLYHWRLLPTSTAMGMTAKPCAGAAQLRTIRDRIQGLRLPAEVMPDIQSGFRLHWNQPQQPNVDVVVCGAQIPAFLYEADAAGHWIKSITLVSAETPAHDARLDAWVHRDKIRRMPCSVNETDAMIDAASRGDGSAIVFIDGRLQSITPNWLEQLAGWVLGNDAIGFAGSLLLTPRDEIIEAGRIVGNDGASAPLFQGMPLYKTGMFGSPLWYRNVTAAGAHAIAFRRSLWSARPNSGYNGNWQSTFVRQCIAARNSGARGLIDPHVRAYRDIRTEDQDHQWDETFQDDPYFHPAFKSLAPLKLRHS